MSLTKRFLDRVEEEQRAKQEALLDLPGKVADTGELLRDLHIELEHSTERIAELEWQLAESNSWKSKLGDYFIGGFIGALMGFCLSLLMR